MSTKTMRLPPRRVSNSMPSSSTTNQKRKDRDGHGHGVLDLKPPAPKSARPAPVGSSNQQLLAGYLAFEFLSRGTVLGQIWDPARSDEEGAAEQEHKRYVELANLMKTGGAHLPGIVNPSDLARL